MDQSYRILLFLVIIALIFGEISAASKDSEIVSPAHNEISMDTMLDSAKVQKGPFFDYYLTGQQLRDLCLKTATYTSFGYKPEEIKLVMMNDLLAELTGKNTLSSRGMNDIMKQILVKILRWAYKSLLQPGINAASMPNTVDFLEDEETRGMDSSSDEKRSKLTPEEFCQKFKFPEKLNLSDLNQVRQLTLQMINAVNKNNSG